jgi:hypothetical protein
LEAKAAAKEVFGGKSRRKRARRCGARRELIEVKFSVGRREGGLMFLVSHEIRRTCTRRNTTHPAQSPTFARPHPP